MIPFHEIDKTAIQSFLSKGWLTHDAMWYYNTLMEFGIDAANRLNRAAIRSMAKFEVERAQIALGMHGRAVDTFELLTEFLTGSLRLLLPSSIKLKLTIPRNNIIRWEWGKGECFAYKGMKQIGVSAQYQCGVIFRIECWLEELGIPYKIVPKLDLCVMPRQGTCAGEIGFFFKESDSSTAQSPVK